MEPSVTAQAPNELCRVVWASHILSYLNPHTDVVSGSQERNPGQLNGDHLDSGEDTDLEEENDGDTASQDNDTLTQYDPDIRKKFLNAIAELLSHTKGGANVTATALRESEDSIEVDLARNGGFQQSDVQYLVSLKAFLAAAGTLVKEPVEVGSTAQRWGRTETFHSFLHTTIDYNANRLDVWIQKAQHLAKGARTRLLNADLPASEPNSLTLCCLQCCTETGTSLSAMVELLFWRTISRGSSVSHLEETVAERRSIVVLASHVLRARETTRVHVKSLIPSVDPAKMLNWWRLLARPVTIIRTLINIAKLLPNFGTVRFIPLERPPQIRLKEHQIPRLPRAWQLLGLPASSKEPITTLLCSKSRKFREDCSRELAIHCEIQLLARYEAEPSLSPTISYFGCSKKACFLCNAFLTLSPLKPGVRGRHGVCHPNWAIPSASGPARAKLTELCSIIKGHILRLLRSDYPLKPNVIFQSSAVSELKSADMVILRQRNAAREAVEINVREERERRQILLDPSAVGPRQIYCRDLSKICAMCQWPTAQACASCLSIWYCGKRCQSIDWPSHKLLCRQFRAFEATRPSKDFKIAIWFPEDGDRPRLSWISFPPARPGNLSRPIFHGAPFPPDMPLGTLPFRFNRRRELSLGHCITVWYPDYSEAINKSMHLAVEACPGMTVPTTLHGAYVVVHGPPYGRATEHADMTLVDYRHTLDFFSTYFDDTVRDMPTSNTVRALKISSPLEYRLYGRETFSTVWVDREFSCPVKGISDIASVLLGSDVWLCSVRETEMERKSGEEDSEEGTGGDWENPLVEVLSRVVNSNVWGRRWGDVSAGSSELRRGAILMRDDGLDLDTELAEFLCGYSVEVLKPLFRGFDRDEISSSAILAEISKERMEAWMTKHKKQRAEEANTA